MPASTEVGDVGPEHLEDEDRVDDRGSQEGSRWAHSLRKSPQPLEFFFTPDEGFLCNIPPGSVSLVSGTPSAMATFRAAGLTPRAPTVELCREPSCPRA